MSPTTLRVYRAYLNVAFDAAVERGLLAESPMQVVPLPPRRTQAAGEDMAFTLPEVQRMLTEFPPVYRALVGLRAEGESLGKSPKIEASPSWNFLISKGGRRCADGRCHPPARRAGG